MAGIYCEVCEHTLLCDACRKKVHQAWHKIGIDRVWPGYCGNDCPGRAQALSLKKAVRMLRLGAVNVDGGLEVELDITDAKSEGV